MDGPDGLSSEQREALALFREVTAWTQDDGKAVQVLKSCGWNVEQALQLHWAAGEDGGLEQPAGSSSSAAAAGAGAAGHDGGLVQPLLGGGARGEAQPGDGAHGAGFGPAGSFFSWVTRGVRRIGASVVNFLCSFIFGPTGLMIGGTTSGAAFTRALTASYGNDLELPNFFEGSFARALSTAQRDLKLLVVYLHSEYAREGRNFCTNVLCNETVRLMLNENFLLWGGDVARMESHQVAQQIQARQYPCFCVLLPASLDEVRAIGKIEGEVQVDAAISLLAACFEEMESHRAEIVARSAQHVEDRHLREQQDREYQEALEMDRKRQEQLREQEREAQEAQRLQEEQERLAREEVEREEAAKRAVDDERRVQAHALGTEGPDATAKIALRLPAGQRAQRKFPPDAKLADVYTWAGCVGHLPENEGRGLEIPRRFVLKTSFPTRDLVAMDSTIQELELSGTNLVLAELEDDEEHPAAMG